MQVIRVTITPAAQIARCAAAAQIARCAVATVIALCLCAAGAHAESDRVGVEERLGETIPLDRLHFTDEAGQPIALKALFDRPIFLTLVYYRCPGICTPVLQEAASVIDKSDLRPGEDYRVVTVSFEPEETAELAGNKKTNMLATLKNKTMPEDGWRFLTGDAENIRLLTESVGFHYMRDANGVDYVHTASVVFLSPTGKIVRYLNGLSINPADFKMAILDAREGRPRAIIQALQKLCYTYNPESRSYVLQINRIILGLTLAFITGFGLWLALRKKSGMTDMDVAASARPPVGGAAGDL